MRKSEAFPSSWIKADDLLDEAGKPAPMTLTIAHIETSEVKDDDGNTKKQRVLSFEDAEKRLGLNLTNWNTLAQISGQDPDDPRADDAKFVGLEVELFRTMVAFKGKQVPAVRIRPVGGWENFGAPKAKPEDKSKSDPDDLPF